MRTVAAQPCSICGGTMVAAAVVAPYAMVHDATGPHMLAAANMVAISACPTCDRPRCPGAGCGMPTGHLLPFGLAEITPTTCDHCARPIAHRRRRG